MYLWRIETLKRDLVRRPLTDRELLPYLLVVCGLTAMLPALRMETMNSWDYARYSWGFLLAIVGTLYVYRCNGGSKGSHFVQRYLSIGLVVGVRWLVGLTAAIIVMLISIDTSAKETTPQFALLHMIAGVLLYARVGHHIRAVANPPQRPNPTEENDAQASPEFVDTPG